MERRSFFKRATAWLCAVPAALSCRPSPAKGRVSQRRRDVRGVLIYRRWPPVPLEDGTTRKAEAIAHFWTQNSQFLSLRNGEEVSRLMDTMKKVIATWPRPSARVYLTPIDTEIDVIVRAYRRGNAKMQVRSWTYFPDMNVMTIGSERNHEAT